MVKAQRRALALATVVLTTLIMAIAGIVVVAVRAVPGVDTATTRLVPARG